MGWYVIEINESINDDYKSHLLVYIRLIAHWSYVLTIWYDVSRFYVSLGVESSAEIPVYSYRYRNTIWFE